MSSTGANGYRLRVEYQADSEERLRETSALAEIEAAVVAHCLAHAPNPPYRPQAIKERLAPLGWQPEIRVPPFDAQYDDLPINDRYDLWRTFEVGDTPIGVAIEIERWEVSGDLLKFRRGIERGQIAVGVVLHDCPDTLAYVYQHVRLISGPLLSEIPVAFAAPEGAGLAGPRPPSQRHFSRYPMPTDPDGASQRPLTRADGG
jgi:hypothetical protein